MAPGRGILLPLDVQSGRCGPVQGLVWLLRQTRGSWVELAAGDGPAADGIDAGLDLVGGGLRERRAVAGPAQLVVDDAVRLAGAVTPGADQAVEFLAQRGQGLAAYRRGRRGFGGGWGGGGGRG